MTTHEQPEDITNASGCPVNSSPAYAGAGDLGRLDMNGDLHRPSMGHRPIDFAPEVLLGQNVPSYRYNINDQNSDSRYQNGDIVDGRYQLNRNRHDRDDYLDNIQDILRDMRTTVEQQRQPIHNKDPESCLTHLTAAGLGLSIWPTLRQLLTLISGIPGRKFQYLAVSLRGEACQAMRFLTPEVKQNYQGLVAVLNRRFSPGNHTKLFQIQLQNRTRRDKEGIPQLAQSIRHLVLQAFPQAHGELFEVLCRDHFLDALGDSDLRFKISKHIQKPLMRRWQQLLKWRPFNRLSDKGILVGLSDFIYLGFYVAFNTVQVISRRVVGRAEETSTYSSYVQFRLCTVNCRPTASNYQLSHLKPCRGSNPGLRGGRRECYHSATVAPRRFVREISSGKSSVDVAQISGANAKATEPRKTSRNDELLKHI